MSKLSVSGKIGLTTDYRIDYADTTVLQSAYS